MVLVSVYSPVQGASVPAWRSTLYSAGVSCSRHSWSVFSTCAGFTVPTLAEQRGQQVQEGIPGGDGEAGQDEQRQDGDHQPIVAAEPVGTVGEVAHVVQVALDGVAGADLLHPVQVLGEGSRLGVVRVQADQVVLEPVGWLVAARGVVRGVRGSRGRHASTVARYPCAAPSPRSWRAAESARTGTNAVKPHSSSRPSWVPNLPRRRIGDTDRPSARSRRATASTSAAGTSGS